MTLRDILAVSKLKGTPLGRVEKTFKISANPETMKRFENFMAYIQNCCGIGHSTSVAMSIDGDGSDVFDVLEPDVKKSLKGLKIHNDYPYESVG